MRLDQQRNVLAARKLAQQRVFRTKQRRAREGRASSHQYRTDCAETHTGRLTLVSSSAGPPRGLTESACALP